MTETFKAAQRRLGSTLQARLALIVAVLLAASLAGCSNRSPAGGPSGGGGAGYIGKTLYGVVLDDELAPLAGAEVSLDETGPNMTTGPDGAFRFTGLEPVDYIVVASMPGHESRAARAAMFMGREFEVNFTLPRLPTGEPRHATQIFKAHISCHVAIKLDWPGWLNQDCGQADPNNKRSTVFTFEEHSSGFLVEYDWEPTQACSGSLRAFIVLRVPGGESFPIVEESIRPGARIHVPPSQFTHRLKTGGELASQLLADRCNDYAGVALQQSVEVHFTAFYFMPVPEDFTALA